MNELPLYQKSLHVDIMSRLIRRLSNASVSSVGSSAKGLPLPRVVGYVGPMAIPADADPQACFEVFCSHWAQIKGEDKTEICVSFVYVYARFCCC